MARPGDLPQIGPVRRKGTRRALVLWAFLAVALPLAPTPSEAQAAPAALVLAFGDELSEASGTLPPGGTLDVTLSATRAGAPEPTTVYLSFQPTPGGGAASVDGVELTGTGQPF